MASLALMVCIIFLVVLLSGPISLFFCFINAPIIATLFAIFAISCGLFWCFVAPFPVSLFIGLVPIMCGVVTLFKLQR